MQGPFVSPSSELIFRLLLSRRSGILLRMLIELSLALLRAEAVLSSLCALTVLRIILVYFHSANRIFTSWCHLLMKIRFLKLSNFDSHRR